MESDLFKKYNLHVLGNLATDKTLVFAHGYGSNQEAWRLITPAFADQYRLVLFDMVGCGDSDVYAFDPSHYVSLHQYADDLIEICDGLQLRQIYLIAHSVSSMIGALAALKRPELFSTLVFIGASPRYLNDEGYVGGFTKTQVANMVLEMGQNYINWLNGFAPHVVDAPKQPELANEFINSLAKMRPGTAIAIAQKIFSSDHRQEVARLRIPVLIIQLSVDKVVPPDVGQYLHTTIPGSQLYWIPTSGHFPHLSNPDAIIEAITQHLERIEPPIGAASNDRPLSG